MKRLALFVLSMMFLTCAVSARAQDSVTRKVNLAFRVFCDTVPQIKRYAEVYSIARDNSVTLKIVNRELAAESPVVCSWAQVGYSKREVIDQFGIDGGICDVVAVTVEAFFRRDTGWILIREPAVVYTLEWHPVVVVERIGGARIRPGPRFLSANQSNFY